MTMNDYFLSFYQYKFCPVCLREMYRLYILKQISFNTAGPMTQKISRRQQLY